MAIEKFDVFVIGTGKSGRDVALACASAGWRVAIADNREYGGTCANRGCDPKKVIVGLTEILARSSLMQGNWLTTMPEFSWRDLQEFKRRFTDAVPFVNERRFKENGIELYHQSPRFIDKQTLSVEGKTIGADKIVIATGQKPATLLFEGAALAKVSDDFLNLEELPESMIFIGGGYVGMELAHVAVRLGIDVSLIHLHERPLNKFDEDMVDLLVEASRNLGIKFHFNARAERIEKLRKNYRVTISQNNSMATLKAEMVFNCAGRVPAVDELELEKGEVEYSHKGVHVDKQLRSITNEHVFACGDVSSSEGKPLTPLASRESEVVISQLLGEGKDRKTAVYPVQPSAVFTIPNIASVGMTEMEARQRKAEIIVRREEVPEWFSSKHINSPVYAFKTIMEKKSDRILGAHLVGENVSEIINLFSLAITHGLTTKDVKHTIFAYPTRGSEVSAMV